MKLVHIKRHGVDVSSSLHVRAKKLYEERAYGIVKPYGLRVLDIQYAFDLWDFYEKKCLEAIDNSESLSIKYEDLLERPSESLNLLIEFLGVNVPPRLLANYTNSFKPDRAFSFKKSKELVGLAEVNKLTLAEHGY
jgi:hypothetical protein